MSRASEEEEKARHDVPGAKSVMKRLGDRERRFIMKLLVKFYDDEGALYSPLRCRRSSAARLPSTASSIGLRESRSDGKKRTG